MKTIEEFRKQVLEEQKGVHLYEDWDDFIDDATLTDILDLNDKAWKLYSEQFRSQSVEQQKEIERLKAEINSRILAMENMAKIGSGVSNRIAELEAQIKEIKEIAKDEINISSISESSRSKLDRIYKAIESSQDQPDFKKFTLYQEVPTVAKTETTIQPGFYWSGDLLQKLKNPQQPEKSKDSD